MRTAVLPDRLRFRLALSGLEGTDSHDRAHVLRGHGVGADVVKAAAVVFSGFLSIPWPCHPPRLGLMLASDQYVRYELAVLAGTALGLARERPPRSTAAPAGTSPR
jgi:hypothetical protein